MLAYDRTHFLGVYYPKHPYKLIVLISLFFDNLIVDIPYYYILKLFEYLHRAAVQYHRHQVIDYLYDNKFLSFQVVLDMHTHTLHNVHCAK